MTTIHISLPDQMKEFVEEEMGEGGYRNPSDYFNALLQEQLRRKAGQKIGRLATGRNGNRIIHRYGKYCR